MIAASPWPPPPHSAAAPTPPPRRRSSLMIVSTTRARHADRVAERDGAAVHVDDVVADAEVAHRRDADRGERLVELEQVDVARGHVVRLERALDRTRRLREQRRVRAGDHSVTDQLGERRDAELLGLRAARHDHRRGAVGYLRRVARGDRAVLGERGTQAGEGFGRRAGPDAFVGVDDHRIALALGDRHRRDLVGEAAFLLGRGRAFVRLGRELVLCFARDATDLADVVLGARAHVHRVERAPQAVVDHRVDDLVVAHAVAGARPAGGTARWSSTPCRPRRRPRRRRCGSSGRRGRSR